MSAPERPPVDLGQTRSSTAGMATLTSQLGLLAFLLAVFATVFAPRSTFGDRARAGGMRTFLGVVHFTPPALRRFYLCLCGAISISNVNVWNDPKADRDAR